MPISRLLPAVLLLAAAQAQQAPPEIQAMHRADTIQALTAGRYGPLTPAQLEQARAGQTTLVLESLFAQAESLFPQAEDHRRKVRIAFQLVRDHAERPIYWRYLFDLATQALTIDAPEFSPLGFPSPALTQWATEHSIPNLPVEQARMRALYDDLDEVTLLHDPRLTPLLRTALASPNREVRTLAAESLANVHDTQSIPAIIKLLQPTSSPDRHEDRQSEQQLIAHALLNFEDPVATAAANTVLPRAPSPLEKLRQGDFEPYTIEQAVNTRPAEAIPLLEAEFPHTQEPLVKLKLAEALIRLGLRTGIYWDFLYAQAQAVIESGVPAPYLLDPSGNPTQPNPAFAAWAKAHKPSIEEENPYLMLAPVKLLTSVADPRAAPLFREGLNSNLPVVVLFSLQGLARLKDPEAIRFTVEQCKRTPAEAFTLAMQLLQFDDDPQAEAAVGHYLSPQMLAEVKKSRALESARGNIPAPR